MWTSPVIGDSDEFSQEFDETHVSSGCELTCTWHLLMYAETMTTETRKQMMKSEEE